MSTATMMNPQLNKLTGKPHQPSYPVLTDDEGAILLATAILKQARKDYVKGVSGGKHDPKTWVERSDLFGILTMGKISRSETIKEWDEAKYVYDMFRKVQTMNQDKQKLKIFVDECRAIVKKKRLTMYELLLKYDETFGTRFTNLCRDDILKQYGWCYKDDMSNMFRVRKASITEAYKLSEGDEVYIFPASRCTIDYQRKILINNDICYRLYKMKPITNKIHYIGIPEPGYLSRTIQKKEVE